MVVVEGVARSFDPKLDIWTTADPVVREWIERNLGPVGRIQGAMSGAGQLAHLFSRLPEIANRTVTVLQQLEDMTREGHMLSPDTIEAIGRKEAKKARVSTIALCVMAAASVGILIALIRM
jgi:ubiquinone biosynthesis protein